jgi:hypothetical protein
MRRLNETAERLLRSESRRSGFAADIPQPDPYRSFDLPVIEVSPALSLRCAFSRAPTSAFHNREDAIERFHRPFDQRYRLVDRRVSQVDASEIVSVSKFA